jgi:hypothetical protein
VATWSVPWRAQVRGLPAHPLSDFVVFLIAMRFNHPLRVRKWLPVATAMPKMLRVLNRHPELGCLGCQQWLGRTTILVQYWRDFDSLDRLSRDKDLPRLEPWRRQHHRRAGGPAVLTRPAPSSSRSSRGHSDHVAGSA